MESNAFYQKISIGFSVSESQTAIIMEILKWKTPIQIPSGKNGN